MGPRSSFCRLITGKGIARGQARVRRGRCETIEPSPESLSLPGLGKLLKGSSLTDRTVDLPEGHYEEESMKATVVPNRNMILLALAGGYALSSGFDTVAYAAHAGDHTIYPDCRPEFADAMEKALGLADWSSLPSTVLSWTLPRPISLPSARARGPPREMTWSCYAEEKNIAANAVLAWSARKPLSSQRWRILRSMKTDFEA